MDPFNDKRGASHVRRRGFVTTRWSIVIAAGQDESSLSRDALSVLCNTYWYPLYAYARRRGCGVEKAEDLTQGFFTRFLEKNDVADADRTRGKFRSYLLASFKHYLANEHDREHAVKRGGKAELVHLDLTDAEHKYNSGMSHGLTPDQEYDKQWALAVLDGALERLANEYAAEGKAQLFAQLRAYLPGSNAELTYRQCAEALAMSEAAVKMAVLRMRKRYRQVLRKQIADTLADQDSVDEEIRYLLHVIGS
ncbi:MAG TPA: sigma-70 family RNA polymerase sigma factor [Candidatus Hydrogenedentes bacterium]|nr:sigma-70 family RNA polymerase sigma factor [Candidatus Hydrogenedentota bacterium]